MKIEWSEKKNEKNYFRLDLVSDDDQIEDVELVLAFGNLVVDFCRSFLYAEFGVIRFGVESASVSVFFHVDPVPVSLDPANVFLEHALEGKLPPEDFFKIYSMHLQLKR